MEKLKLFLSLLMVMLLSVGNVWATDFTLSSAEEVTKDGITVTFAKGEGSNAPAWYSAGLRLYVKNTVTITSTSNITAISFNWEKQGSKTFNTSCTASTGSYTHPSSAGVGTWTGSATSVTFTLGNVSGAQLQLNTFSVTTEGGGSSDPSLSVDPIVIDFGTVEQNAVVASQTVEVSFANLTGSVAYSDLSSPFTASGTISSTGDEITIAANTANVGNYSQTLTVQSTADSKSAEVTVKMNVVEPFDGLKLTFDFVTHPEGWPAAKASAVAGNYVYTISATDYTFAHSEVGDGIYCGGTSGSSGYLMIAKSNSLGLPAISGYKLVKVEGTLNNSGTPSTKAEITITNGTDEVTGGASQTWDEKGVAKTYNLSGTVANTMYYLNVSGTANLQMITLVLYYEEAEAPTVAAPTISGVTPFLSSTEVTLTQNDADAIYYTTDEAKKENPSVDTWTEYNSASKPSFNATTTIYAAAIKGSAWSAVAEKTFTKATVLTVAEAIAAIPNKDDVVNNQYVEGIVCTAGTSVNASGQMTYYISADGTEATRLQIYLGKNLNNTAFTAVSDLAIGDRVVVFGQLKNYNNTPEMNSGNYLVLKETPAVAAPTFSPDGGGFTGETDVTISCATASSAIYYTLDGSAPSKLSTLYESAIHLNATTTINAIAFVGDDASLVISRTFTLSEPMTVAEALTALDSENPINNVAVAGIISTAPTSNPSSGKLTYYISDDGSASNELEVYKGFGIGGASFSDKTDLQVGNEVTVFGNLTIYNTTKEFAEGSRLIAFNRPVVAVSSVSLPATETVEVGSTVTLTATVLPDNASDKSITWTVESGDTYASVENGVVSGLVAGEAVIRATSVADGTKYVECTVTVVAADPTKHKVTFDATVDMGESPLSKSNISMACTSGALDNGSEYRLYKSSTTTFECSVGNIIKIEFTGVSGNPISGFGNPEVGTLVTEGNNGVWTGNAESVSFVASGAQVRATEIVVTYKEDNRAAAGLTWSTDAVELTVGDEFTAPTLNNPNSIAASAITIASDNTELATVSEGVVSLVADATGTATITATFEGNEDYKPAVVSYTITVNEAGLDNVTFDATQDIAGTNELSISKSGFTLEFTDGALGNGSEYRLYKSQTMTLSSTDYLIKKIEFTCTSGNPISGFADAEGLDKANNQWTGEANSIELTASNAQVRIEKLKVYYIEDTRAASGLAWSTDEVEITLGDDFTAASLVNPNSIDAAEILIESSNTDLATVTAGVVELVADATGTATITATFEGNATYKPAEFSYTIKVNDPTPQIITNPTSYLNFGSKAQGATIDAKNLEVTLNNVSAATVAITGDGAAAFSATPMALTGSGTIVVSASSTNQGTFSATLTISDDANGAEPKGISLSLTITEPVVEETAVSTTSKWVAATDADLVDGAEVLIVNNTDYYAMGVQNSNNRAAVAASVDGKGVLTPGEGTMAFTLVAQGDGTFALRTSNGKYLYAASSSKNYLRSQADVDNNAKWTLTTTSASAEASENNHVMQFNSSSSIFSCYGSASQKAIAFYVPYVEPTPEPVYETVREELAPNAYYTMCLEQAVTEVKGGTIWRVLSKAQNDKDVILEEVTGTLDAGRPYIFYATAGKLEVVYTDDAVGAPLTEGNNGLIGSFSQVKLDQSASTFILYNNALYYVNSDNVYVGAHRAYLDMNGVPAYSNEPVQGNAPRRRVTMAVHGEQVATGVDQVPSDQVTSTKVLINGQLFILRGEKMYDVTGKLVK